MTYSQRSTKSRSERSGSKPKGAPRAKSGGAKTRKPIQLSPARKLDIYGAILALLGALMLACVFFNQTGTITEQVNFVLDTLGGQAGFILPVAFLGVGIWMVLRRLEALPEFSAGRVVGLVLFILNLYTFFFILGGKATGGWLGSIFGQLLLDAVGFVGALLVLFAWFLIALALVMDISVPDIFRNMAPMGRWMGARAKGLVNVVKPKGSAKSSRYFDGDEASSELPEDFHPLETQGIGRPTGAQRVPRTAAAGAQPFTIETETAQPNVSVAIQPSPTTGSVIPETKPETPAQPPAPVWTLPSIESVLDPASPVFIREGVDTERAKVIEETLRSFGAPARVVEIQRGPTITQFGVEPEFVENRQGKTRVRVSAIARLVDDLALALAAPRIRIQAPVPGRSYVGIEVPNPEISLVALREVMESDAYKKIKTSLRIALGKDVAGQSVCTDLTYMPHLLIAGTTGSGKSVCVNSLLTSLLLQNTPNDLRLVLVDPKRVELTGYNGIPHLLAPVVVETERVVGALQWILREMDNRYHKFAQAGARNIQDYNARSTSDHLPYLVLVVDELADLMMLAPEETERCITRLAQLARATGIHVVIATQRPSVDVVTGLIKANFPARIAFAVASNTDSRVILDQPGAERLLGRGDMLFQAPDAPAPVRLQGTFVSDQEIQRLVENWRLQVMNNTRPVEGATPNAEGQLPRGMPLVQAPLWDAPAPEAANINEDPLLPEAIALVRREGRASISMLQRRMRIGYTRAARLVDAMEEQKIIGPSLANSQVRQVLDFGQGAPPKEE